MTTLDSVQYGWGDGSEDGNALFWVKFFRCRTLAESWREEIRRAATQLANGTGKPLWVCLSGGIDSEVVCQTFVELGIAFKVVTLAFDEASNGHDIKYAIEWCRTNRIEQRVVPFNMEWLASRIPNLLDQGFIADQFFRYYQIHMLELVEEMGGFVLFEARNLELHRGCGRAICSKMQSQQPGNFASRGGERRQPPGSIMSRWQFVCR